LNAWREVGDLSDRPLQVHAPAGRHRVHPPHQVCQALQRVEYTAQQQDIDGDDHEQAACQHGDLGGGQRRADGRWGEREHERGDDEHARVDCHHAPEERHVHKVPSRSSAHHGR